MCSIRRAHSKVPGIKLGFLGLIGVGSSVAGVAVAAGVRACLGVGAVVGSGEGEADDEDEEEEEEEEEGEGDGVLASAFVSAMVVLDSDRNSAIALSRACMSCCCSLHHGQRPWQEWLCCRRRCDALMSVR